MWLALLLGLGVASPSAQAATNLPPQSDRWLFVVDTSGAMAGRADASRRLAATLLWSGVNGQMRDGDTVGVWTFNSGLHAGQFPLQIWTRATRRQVAQRVYEFLKAQPSGGRSRFESVLGPLRSLVRSSDCLTVVLFSDGQSKIRGTPFDDQINAQFAAWESQQQKSQMPFVTFLRAEGGRFTNFVVNTPPWPLQLPPLPKAPPAKIAAAKPAPRPPQPVFAPPLIVRGTTVESPSNAAPAAAPISSTPSSAPAAAGSSGGSAKQSAKPVPAQPANPAPAAINSESAPAATPAPAAATPVNSTEPAGAPELNSNPRNAGAPPVVAKPVPPRLGEPPVAPPRAEAEGRAPVRQGGRQQSSPAPAASAPMQPENPSPRETTVPAQTATAAPAGNFSRNGNVPILVLGSVALVLGCVALAIAIVLLRRVRASTGASLITRSLEREKK